MNIKHFTFAVIRLFSVYLFLQALLNLKNIILSGISGLAYVTSPEYLYSLIGMMISFVILLIMGVILFKLTDRIVNAILPVDYDNDIDNEDKTFKISSVIFIVVGLYIITISLSELGRVIILAFSVPADAWDQSTQIKYTIIGDGVESIIKLILGVYLAIGNKGVCKIISKIRASGMHEG